MCPECGSADIIVLSEDKTICRGCGFVGNKEDFSQGFDEYILDDYETNLHLIKELEEKTWIDAVI